MKLAVERKSERMDTAYSPRLHEEELSDADNERAANVQMQTPPAKRQAANLLSRLFHITALIKPPMSPPISPPHTSHQLSQ